MQSYYFSSGVHYYYILYTIYIVYIYAILLYSDTTVQPQVGGMSNTMYPLTLLHAACRSALKIPV